jgi:hypothetical protein
MTLAIVNIFTQILFVVKNGNAFKQRTCSQRVLVMEKLESLIRQVSEAIMASDAVEEVLAKSLADYVAATPSILSLSLDTSDWVTSSIDRVISSYPSMFRKELLKRALEYNIISLSRLSGLATNDELLLEANFRTKAGNIAENLLKAGSEDGFAEKLQLKDLVYEHFFKTGLIYAKNNSLPDFAESAFVAFEKAGDAAKSMAEDLRNQGSDPKRLFGNSKMLNKSVAGYLQALKAYQYAFEICPFQEGFKAAMAYEAAGVADKLSAALKQENYRNLAIRFYSGFLSYYNKNPSREWYTSSLHAHKRSEALRLLGSFP